MRLIRAEGISAAGGSFFARCAAPAAPRAAGTGFVFRGGTKEDTSSIIWEYEYNDIYESGDSTGSNSTASNTSSGSGNSIGVDDNYQHNTGTENLEGNTYLSGFPIVCGLCF